MSTAQVMLLSLVAVPLLLAGGGLWLFWLRRRGVVAVGIFAMGLALAAVAASTSVVAGLHSGGAATLASVLALPLGVYAGVFVAAFKKFNLAPLRTVGAAVAFLGPLLYLAAHVFVLVGCAAAKECL